MQISKINKKEVDDEIARFNAETKEMTELDKAEVSRMKERIALDNRVINATIANPESTYGEVYDALRMYGGSKLPEEIHEILATFVYKQKEALRVDENRQVAADNILKGAQMELAKWIKGTDSMPFDERKNILRALPLLPKEFVDKSISDLDKEQRELDVARVTANKKEEVIVAKNRVNDVVALADQGAPIQMTFSDFVNIVGAGYGGEEIPQRVLTLLNRFTDKTTQARVINDILNNRETVGDVNPDNFFDMAASKNQAVTNMLDKTLSNINTPEDVDAVLAKVDALSQVNYSFDDKHDASIKWLKYLSGTRDSTTALEIYKLATKPGAKLNSEQAKALIGNLRRNDITTTYSISSPGMGAIAKVVDLVSSAQLTDSEAKEFLDGFVQDKFIGYSTLFGIGDTVPTFIPKTSHINNEKAYAKVLKNASDLVSGKVTLVFPAKPYDAENSNWNITYMENNMLRTKTIDIDTLNALARGTHKKDK